MVLSVGVSNRGKIGWVVFESDWGKCVWCEQYSPTAGSGLRAGPVDWGDCGHNSGVLN